jgi:DNA-binding NtrC family response regulator
MAKVLVADDDYLLCWSLEQSLKRDGHDFKAIGSGFAAVEAVSGGAYQVAIISYSTTTPSGLQVLRWIKARAPQTHVIVMTSEPSPQMERYARDTGAFDFLEKPFRLSALKQAIDRAIATPERRKGSRGCCGGCEWRSPCNVWGVIPVGGHLIA